MTKASYFDLTNERLAAGDLLGLQKLFKSATDNRKREILQALGMGPNKHLAIGPEIVELAVQGLNNKEYGTRIWACDVIADQKAKKVDVSAAIEPLLGLLNDHSLGNHPAYAAGHLYNRKHDMSAHFAALRKLLSHPDEEVAAAAAWAIGQFSKGKFDVGPAVRDLARLLANPQDSIDLRKNAAQVLLHHAKKSPAALAEVRKAVKTVKLDDSQKDVQKFVKQLAAV